MVTTALLDRKATYVSWEVGDIQDVRKPLTQVVNDPTHFDLED